MSLEVKPTVPTTPATPAVNTPKPLTIEQRSQNAKDKLMLIETKALANNGKPGHNPYMWMKKSGFDLVKTQFIISPLLEYNIEAVEAFDGSNINTSTAQWDVNHFDAA